MKKDDTSGLFVFNMIVHFFIETFVSMALGYYLGKFLDSIIFPQKQILVYIFIIFGIFAALANLTKKVLRISKGDEDEKDKSD